MAHPTCSLPREEEPEKCKWCPLSPEQRFDECKYFRSQMRAGVPWKRVSPELQVKWKASAGVKERAVSDGRTG